MFSTLAEDLGLTPSIQIAAHNHLLIQVSGFNVLFWPFQVLRTHGAHTHTCWIDNMYTITKYLKVIFEQTFGMFIQLMIVFKCFKINIIQNEKKGQQLNFNFMLDITTVS
jgi:hypothetical protein